MQKIWKGMIYNNKDYSELFEISNNGDVFSKRSGKILNPQINQSGYLRFVTTINGEKINFGIHRAVACTFIPNPENLPEVNHIDGEKLNNHFSNLEWVTNQENQIHAVNHDLKQCFGEDNPAAKLTEKDILYIRDNYIPNSKEFGQRALARQFNVSKTCIRDIILNKYWKNI